MLEEEANKRFEKGFSSLEAEQMDEILTAFQNDEIPMTGVTSAFFFRSTSHGDVGGSLCRSNVWWKSQYGWLEDERVSWSPNVLY